MKLKKYKSQMNNDLSHKLKSYSALTGAFILSAAATDAQIVYTDINPDVSITRANYDIDLDHDGLTDLAFQHMTTYTIENVGSIRSPLNLGNGLMASFTKFEHFSAYFPLNLMPGHPIGPGGPFCNFLMQNWLRLARHYVGQFQTYSAGFFLDSSGYLGLEFISNGNTYYGWIECEMDSVGSAIVIKGYAYESTPNQYIIAGSGKTDDISEQNISITSATSFYPNPVRNGKAFINIDAKKFTELKIEVINGMGQILKSDMRELNTGMNLVDLDVNYLTGGAYFVRLTHGDQSYFRKIVVAK